MLMLPTSVSLGGSIEYPDPQMSTSEANPMYQRRRTDSLPKVAQHSQPGSALITKLYTHTDTQENDQDWVPAYFPCLTAGLRPFAANLWAEVKSLCD